MDHKAKGDPIWDKTRALLWRTGKGGECGQGVEPTTLDCRLLKYNDVVKIFCNGIRRKKTLKGGAILNHLLSIGSRYRNEPDQWNADEKSCYATHAVAPLIMGS